MTRTRQHPDDGPDDDRIDGVDPRGGGGEMLPHYLDVGPETGESLPGPGDVVEDDESDAPRHAADGRVDHPGERTALRASYIPLLLRCQRELTAGLSNPFTKPHVSRI